MRWLVLSYTTENSNVHIDNIEHDRRLNCILLVIKQKKLLTQSDQRQNLTKGKPMGIVLCYSESKTNKFCTVLYLFIYLEKGTRIKILVYITLDKHNTTYKWQIVK